jgi:hypothetical protein
MLVEGVLAELRERLVGTSLRLSEPVYALSSWYIDIDRGNFRVTVEYTSRLGLFGLSSNCAVEGVEEIYRDSAEVVDRVVILAAKQGLCTAGRVSPAAYAWSKEEAERLGRGSPDYAEHAAIVRAFEVASLRPHPV